MSAPETPSPEFRAFELPIRLTIGDREIEVPITVTVTFDELTRMVERNLSEGEELYTQLMEHYADQAGRKKGRKPPSSAESRSAGRSRAAEPSEAPPAAANGAGGKPRRKPAAPAPGDFPAEELAAWRGKLPPPFAGRGKKSRDRLLWEAANPDPSAE